MKKTYSKPEATVFASIDQDILAGSPLNLAGDSGQAKVYSTELDASDEVLSRSNFWGEEE